MTRTARGRVRKPVRNGLAETTLFSVKEIKEMVGVLDESHFVRDFEMACGLTPARYRTEHNNDKIKKTVVKVKKAKSANE